MNMNMRLQPNNMSHVQRPQKRNINQNKQDNRDYLGGDNEYLQENKQFEYHNPKDLSWTQF